MCKFRGKSNKSKQGKNLFHKFGDIGSETQVGAPVEKRKKNLSPWTV
jgi:hypothetical protein